MANKYVRGNDQIIDKDLNPQSDDKLITASTDESLKKRGLDTVVINDLFAKDVIAPLLSSIRDTLIEIKDHLIIITDEKDPMIWVITLWSRVGLNPIKPK